MYHHGIFHGLRGALEFHDHTVAHGFYDGAAVFGGLRPKYVKAPLHEIQRLVFVSTHSTTVIDEICKQDGLE